MLMTREELRKWAESLKQGDKVISHAKGLGEELSKKIKDRGDKEE